MKPVFRFVFNYDSAVRLIDYRILKFKFASLRPASWQCQEASILE